MSPMSPLRALAMESVLFAPASDSSLLDLLLSMAAEQFHDTDVTEAYDCNDGLGWTPEELCL